MKASGLMTYTIAKVCSLLLIAALVLQYDHTRDLSKELNNNGILQVIPIRKFAGVVINHQNELVSFLPNN